MSNTEMKSQFPADYSFIRYLESKRSVDSRAFNQNVWKSFTANLKSMDQKKLNVIEFGAGVGSMAERIIPKIANKEFSYTMLDSDKELLDIALKRLPADNASLDLVAHEAIDWLRNRTNEVKFNVVIAHAFMDLVDISKFIKLLIPHLDQGTLLYFPINFDGQTLFEPLLDPEFETQLISTYHQSMESEEGSNTKGTSKSARKLISSLSEQDFEVVETGSSDWIVQPESLGYPEDEAYFLFHILKFFENELESQVQLDKARFRNWLLKRRTQILDAQLSYRAIQQDIFAIFP